MVDGTNGTGTKNSLIQSPNAKIGVFMAPVETVPESVVSGPITPFPWETVGWVSLLLAIVYGQILYSLAYVWATNEDMGHGYCH